MIPSQVLQVSLLTLGDPSTMTGGYLFHRRLADLAPEFAALVRFVSFPARPFPLPLLSASAVLGVALRQSPDVVVIDSIVAAYLAPALVGRRIRVPLVGMLHQPPGGIDHSAVRTSVQRALDRITYRRAARLLVASQALAEDLGRLGYPPRLVRVVAPGRDVVDAADAGSAGSPDLRQGRRIAVLSVGNWARRKGLLDLLEAVALLPPDAVTLHLVGDTEVDRAYGARVRDRLRHPDLADRVVVHGPQPREQVAALYRDADVFALASRVEPYGTVYAEAMAFGLPVVGWSSGNLPHLAEPGREGFVLPPGDIPGLADALLQLSVDEGLRRRLGTAARERAATFPTWKDTARTIFAELRSAVSPS